MNRVEQQIEICRRNSNLREYGETIEVMREALQNIAALDHTRAATNCAAFNAVTYARTALNIVDC